jgi:hypothetical protein
MYCALLPKVGAKSFAAKRKEQKWDREMLQISKCQSSRFLI